MITEIKISQVQAVLAEYVLKLELKNTAENLEVMARTILEAMDYFNPKILRDGLPLYIAGQIENKLYGKTVDVMWFTTLYRKIQAYNRHNVIVSSDRTLPPKSDPTEKEVDERMKNWLTGCRKQVEEKGRITFVTVAPLYEWLESKGKAPYGADELEQFRVDAEGYVNSLDNNGPFDKALNLTGHRGVEKRMKHYALESAIKLGIV